MLIWVGILAAATAIFTELLSLLGLLNRSTLTGYWILVGVFAAWRGTAVGAHKRAVLQLSSGVRSYLDWPLPFKLASILLAALTTVLLAVALKSPPNTTDSLTYHMARVAHWAQAGNLGHYAASYHPQLWNAIGAELAVLHLYLLADGHAWVNLVQWSSLVGAVLAVSVLAAELGAGGPGQLVAAVFAATAPASILQATSTQTDLVAGFWVVASVALVMPLLNRSLGLLEWAALGSAIGMGMLTKGIYYPIAAPMLLLVFLLGWRRERSIRELSLGVVVILTAAFVMNLGYWARNLTTYGGPFGSAEWMSIRTSASFQPLAPIVRIVQEIAINFPTPWEPANGIIEDSVRSVSAFLGVPSPDFTIQWAWNHEDLAGSPLHMASFAVVSMYAIFAQSDRSSKAVRWYAFAIILAFAAFSWLIGFNPFGARHHIPFFLLAGPLLGVVLEGLGRPGFLTAALFAFLISSLPWVFLNQTRPLIGWKPRTRTQSIFRATERELIFANTPDSREAYTKGTRTILESDCDQIGTSLDSRDPEYALWWLLGAPSDSLEIRSVRPLPSLESLRDDSFHPCAIFCTNCGDRKEFLGLTLAEQEGRVSVFLSSP